MLNNSIKKQQLNIRKKVLKEGISLKMLNFGIIYKYIYNYEYNNYIINNYK